jgi:hypothetical protein
MFLSGFGLILIGNILAGFCFIFIIFIKTNIIVISQLISEGGAKYGLMFAGFFFH